jgi:hypothetical protein
MEISLHQFERAVRITSELAVIATLIRTGRIRPYLKKSEAFRCYGRKNIEKWITEGWITPRKDGDHSAAWRIDRIEVEIHVKSRALQILLDAPGMNS